MTSLAQFFDDHEPRASRVSGSGATIAASPSLHVRAGTEASTLPRQPLHDHHRFHNAPKGPTISLKTALAPGQSVSKKSLKDMMKVKRMPPPTSPPPTQQEPEPLQEDMQGMHRRKHFGGAGAQEGHLDFSATGGGFAEEGQQHRHRRVVGGGRAYEDHMDHMAMNHHDAAPEVSHARRHAVGGASAQEDHLRMGRTGLVSSETNETYDQAVGRRRVNRGAGAARLQAWAQEDHLVGGLSSVAKNQYSQERRHTMLGGGAAQEDHLSLGVGGLSSVAQNEPSTGRTIGGGRAQEDHLSFINGGLSVEEDEFISRRRPPGSKAQDRVGPAFEDHIGFHDGGLSIRPGGTKAASSDIDSRATGRRGRGPAGGGTKAQSHVGPAFEDHIGYNHGGLSLKEPDRDSTEEYYGRSRGGGKALSRTGKAYESHLTVHGQGITPAVEEMPTATKKHIAGAAYQSHMASSIGYGALEPAESQARRARRKVVGPNAAPVPVVRSQAKLYGGLADVQRPVTRPRPAPRTTDPNPLPAAGLGSHKGQTLGDFFKRQPAQTLGESLRKHPQQI